MVPNTTKLRLSGKEGQGARQRRGGHAGEKLVSTHSHSARPVYHSDDRRRGTTEGERRETATSLAPTASNSLPLSHSLPNAPRAHGPRDFDRGPRLRRAAGPWTGRGRAPGRRTSLGSTPTSTSYSRESLPPPRRFPRGRLLSSRHARRPRT